MDDGLDEAENVCCASFKSAPISKALQTTPANACSAASAETDCVKKRDPRGDENIGVETRLTELDSNARLKKRASHTIDRMLLTGGRHS